VSPFQDTLIFRADFNSMLHDGRIAVTRRYASGLRKPDFRERVVLRDSEHNRCEAVVQAVRGSAVHVIADLATWSPGSNVSRTDISLTGHPEPYVEITGPDPESQPEFAVVG